MEIFKNMREFFFPSDVPEGGSSAPNPEVSAPHHGIEEMEPQRETSSNIVNISATAQLQVVLVKPEVFTDAKAIADHLIAHKTVVLNLETASPENRRRIIDFLVGVSYAIGGSLKPVANLTYIITPYNVGFIGDDLAAELENNGVII
ncbi:MAG: cell division protein SepF [Oscillospiraceae bacterium]|nr:cell division protein SepF [Oscillospiraceae bacterium]